MNSNPTTETFDIMAHAKRVQRKQELRRYATVGAGLSLLLLGWSVRVPFKLAMVALGAGLTIRGLTDHKLRENVQRLQKGLHERMSGVRRERGLDTVDEASWESFPASDPPSFAPR